MPRPKRQEKLDLRPVTVYLSDREIADLNHDAVKAGRSGLSAEIRYVLAQRRRGERQ